jgi:hypothetical protein
LRRGVEVVDEEMERDRYCRGLRGIVEDGVVVEVEVLMRAEVVDVMTDREEGGAVGQGRRRGKEVR